MTEKKEGAMMKCSKCGLTLTCRMSNYAYPYQNKLQWQNDDGSAHYKFASGKISCTGEKWIRKALMEQDQMLKDAELSKGKQNSYLDLKNLSLDLPLNGKIPLQNLQVLNTFLASQSTSTSTNLLQFEQINNSVSTRTII